MATGTRRVGDELRAAGKLEQMINNGTMRPPVPDPTVLTTQQLDKAVECLREIHDQRFIGMDKAIVEALQATIDKLPALRQEAVEHLKHLHQEKFDSISSQIAIQFDGVKTQFLERDKRTEQLSLADKAAIAAALQAQKENASAATEMVVTAMAKIEANFTKLIEQGQTLLQVGFRNADEKTNDLKSRFDRGEGKTSVSDPANTEALKLLAIAVGNLSKAENTSTGHSKGVSDSNGFVFALIGAGLAAASVALVAFKVVT